MMLEVGVFRRAGDHWTVWEYVPAHEMLTPGVEYKAVTRLTQQGAEESYAATAGPELDRRFRVVFFDVDAEVAAGDRAALAVSDLFPGLHPGAGEVRTFRGLLQAPRDVDAGLGAVNSPVGVSIELAAIGSSPVTITDIQISGRDLSWHAQPATPLALHPSEKLTLEVVFSPAESGPRQGFIVVESDDPVNPTQKVIVRGHAMRLL